MTRKYLDIYSYSLYNLECCLEVIDMKWSINQLQKYREGKMPFDEMVNLESVLKRNPEIRKIDPVHVSGTCDIGSYQIDCHFRLEGTMILPCARTWEDVSYPFSIESTETFSWDEDTLREDDEIHPVEGEVIHISPVLEELILLDIPLQVYSEKAKDIETMEGKGWSFALEDVYEEQKQEEAEETIDPRLAGLANFFDKKDE